MERSSSIPIQHRLHSFEADTVQGAYLPSFDPAHPLSWRVNGQLITADSTAEKINKQSDENGDYVMIGSRRIDLPTGRTLTPHLEGVASVGSKTMAVFSYTNSATTNVHVPYGPDNHLAIDGFEVFAPPQRPPAWFVPSGGTFIAEISSTSLSWKARLPDGHGVSDELDT